MKLDFLCKALAVLENFAKRLKEERNRLVATQPQFAAWGGVKKNSQIAYESGATAPSVEYMFRIADKGADITYIMTGWRNIEGGSSVEQDYIFGLYVRLSPREREAVKSLLVGLAGGDRSMQESSHGTDFLGSSVHEMPAMRQEFGGRND